MMTSKVGAAVTVSRGASYLTIQTLVISVAQVLAFAVLTRIITPAEVGILAILSLITNLAQTIDGGAFSYAAIRYVGEFAGTDDKLAVGVFFQTFWVSTVFSLLIAAVIFVESGYLAETLLGAASQAGLFSVLAIDVFAFGGMLPVANAALLGARRFKASAAIGTFGGVLRQCLIILLILMLKNFIGLVYGWVLSDFAMVAAYCVYAVRILGVTKRPFPIRKLLSFSWPLSVGNLVGFWYSWFDRAILIAFVPLESLGVYNAALAAYSVLAGVWNAISSTLLPVYSNIVGTKGLEACRRAVRVSSRYVSLIMVPLAFGLLATAKPALTLFVGQPYANGVIPLMVLSLAFALTSFGLVLGVVLIALARTRQAMLITAASAAVGLASGYVLLPLMGIVGASAARAIATFAAVGLYAFVLKRMHALSVDVEMAWKSIVAGVVMAIVLVVIQLFVYSKLLLPFYMVVGALVYVILLWVLRAVREHDIELIEKYLGTRFGFIAKLLGKVLVR